MGFERENRLEPQREYKQREMKNELTDLRKWNKRNLVARILTFPIKIAFQILWGVISSIFISFKWLKNGSQEVVYGDNHGESLVNLIEQNEKIIEHFEKEK